MLGFVACYSLATVRLQYYSIDLPTRGKFAFYIDLSRRWTRDVRGVLRKGLVRAGVRRVGPNLTHRSSARRESAQILEARRDLPRKGHRCPRPCRATTAKR